MKSEITIAFEKFVVAPLVVWLIAKNIFPADSKDLVINIIDRMIEGALLLSYIHLAHKMNPTTKPSALLAKIVSITDKLKILIPLFIATPKQPITAQPTPSTISPPLPTD